MIDQVTLAWLGGFFSGEGCVSVGRNHSGRLYLSASLSNSDHDAVLRFQQAFGGSVHERPPGKNPLQRKMMWMWRLTQQDRVLAFIIMIRPYLSVDKWYQAERGIDAIQTQPEVDRGAAWRTRRARYGSKGRPVTVSTESHIRPACQHNQVTQTTSHSSDSSASSTSMTASGASNASTRCCDEATKSQPLSKTYLGQTGTTVGHGAVSAIEGS